MYKVPEEFYFRIHHIRPRFKNNVEDVLLFMANEISKLEPVDNEKFKAELNRALRLYPGNASKKEKTINNWRTEISALFGFIEYEGNISEPSRMAKLLVENQDLIEFFRYFLFYFQYPGGHLKPRLTAEFIKEGVRFKPARYIIQVLYEGGRLFKNKKFGISKAETTHCIFNDIRVTRDNRSPKETAKLIIRNRKGGTEYDQGGDVTRYAGDILDYMEIADLIKLRPNYLYYLNTTHLEILQAFIKNDVYFKPYESMYGVGEIATSDITETQGDWFKYVNNKLDSSIFEADILSIIEEIGEKAETPKESAFIKEVLIKIQKARESKEAVRTKEIGDTGEAIVIEHEKVRLTMLKRKDIIHLVKKIPEAFAVGYDIGSYEGKGNLRRLIEVKTTVSRGRLSARNFQMTPSEWSAADSHRKIYFIYRLMISSQDVSLFLIQDPVGKYKSDLLDMVPREGVNITYSEKSGNWERLLI